MHPVFMMNAKSGSRGEVKQLVNSDLMNFSEDFTNYDRLDHHPMLRVEKLSAFHIFFTLNLHNAVR